MEILDRWISEDRFSWVLRFCYEGVWGIFYGLGDRCLSLKTASGSSATRFFFLSSYTTSLIILQPHSYSTHPLLLAEHSFASTFLSSWPLFPVHPMSSIPYFSYYYLWTTAYSSIFSQSLSLSSLVTSLFHFWFLHEKTQNSGDEWMIITSH